MNSFMFFIIGIGFGLFLGYEIGYGKATRNEADEIRRLRSKP